MGSLVKTEETRLPLPLAAAGKIHRLLGTAAWHDRADRAEGFDIVHRLGLPGLVAIKQDRIEEGAGFSVTRHKAWIVRIAGDDLGIGEKIADARADLVTLGKACKRAHADGFIGGIAERGLAKTLAKDGDQRVAIGAAR